jgi:thioredoxin:protein disulfide reductase
VKRFKPIIYIISGVIIVVAVYALILSKSSSVDWIQYSEDGVSQIKGKGAIIDFYADWCIPCKELDASTFSDTRVIEESKNYETYKADMTKSLSEEVEALREKYKIVGVPTVLILDNQGNELNRITGFINADEFLKLLK